MTQNDDFDTKNEFDTKKFSSQLEQNPEVLRTFKLNVCHKMAIPTTAAAAKVLVPSWVLGVKKSKFEYPAIEMFEKGKNWKNLISFYFQKKILGTIEAKLKWPRALEFSFFLKK